MRTLFCLSLAFTCAAAAAAQPEESSVIQVRGVSQTYKLTPQQIDEVKGVYRLDNGGTVKIAQEHRRLQVQVGRDYQAELLPIGENLFVSADDRVTMEFRPLAFGDEILLRYPSDFNVAGSPLVTVTLAAGQRTDPG